MIDAVTSIATSVDEDGSRRKRRKTDSPTDEPGDSWEKTPKLQDGQHREARSKITSSSRPPNVSGTTGVSSPFSDSGHQSKELSTPNAQASTAPKNVSAQLEKSTKEPKLRARKGISVPAEARPTLMSHSEAPIDGGVAQQDPVPPHPPAQSRTPPSRKRIKARTDGEISSTTRLKQGFAPQQDGSRSQNAKAKTCEGPIKVIKVRADGKLVSPKIQKLRENSPIEERQDPAPTQATMSSTVYGVEGRTTPKKLMKVRSDGRLASPKSRANVEEPQKKRRGRPRKIPEAIRKGLVVIKYGMTNESRIAVCQRIEEILSSPLTLPISKESTRPASKPPEPPKATHPFFSGDFPQKPRTDMNRYNEHEKVELEGTTSGHECSSNPTKRKSPRKVVASVNGRPRADMGASGQSSVLFGGSTSRKLPGAFNPIWPPLGMAHVRPIPEMQPNTLPSTWKHSGRVFEPANVTKHKQIEVSITENEEVLCGCRSLVKNCTANGGAIQIDNSQPKLLCIPQRRVMSGRDLQRFHTQRNPFRPSQPIVPERDDLDEFGEGLHPADHTHPALSLLLDRIPTSRTAFDRFECETQDWTHKYAPTKAEEVLQPGNETAILKGWLQSLTVNTVGRGGGTVEAGPKTLKKASAGIRRKKRKRAEELDGFVVSSDEEANEMDELDNSTLMGPSQPLDGRNKKTVIKAHDAAKLVDGSDSREKATNAVVLSGPSGCGKTAAVYAVAQELGFEVFEINAGSRRSGKDIFDKVGDMSRNHLVNQSRASETEGMKSIDEDLSRMDDALKQDLQSGRQGTMNAFLQPKKSKTRPITKAKHAEKDHGADTKSKPKVQKQSVILLEEVDVLFEDDKQFWATTLELILQSRRPVVMTCTDESLLPLDDLALFGILRFRQPYVPLATEYLLLLAANEGHLLSREAVSALYTVKCNDLRASITELQFFCQMAIGDTKGGLEWMLDQPATKDNEEIVAARVVSDGTYLHGMGWIGQQCWSTEDEQEANSEIDLVTAVCSGWDTDLAVADEFLPGEMARSLTTVNHCDRLNHLETLDLVCDALSAADTLRCPSFRTTLTASIDVSTPELCEKDRINFTEGSPLLQADLLVDHSGVSDSIAAALRVFARRTFLDVPPQAQQFKPLNEGYVANILPKTIQEQRRPKPVTPQTLSTAFHPLSNPSRGSLVGKGPFLSSFDNPIATIVTDIAPYVRSIVSYDLRLEEQRRQLELASQTGRDGKRARRTRASRAALEGGSKANTRRERWFPGNTDFGAVLGSGGRAWQEVALRRGGVEEAEGSMEGEAERRGSVGSIGSRESGVQAVGGGEL